MSEAELQIRLCSRIFQKVGNGKIARLVVSGRRRFYATNGHLKRIVRKLLNLRNLLQRNASMTLTVLANQIRTI